MASLIRRVHPLCIMCHRSLRGRASVTSNLFDKGNINPSTQPQQPIPQLHDVNNEGGMNPLSSSFDPEFLQSIGPSIPVTFNLAAFVNRSRTLQELVKLGVDLSVVERERDAAEFLAHADFDRHIKPYIEFLVDLGVKASQLGAFITQNPFIMKQNLVNLNARVQYLRDKKFPSKAITQIVSSYPSFLNYSVKEVDARLGFLQEEYALQAKAVRSLLLHYPQVMSLHVMTIRSLTFSIKEEMGFTDQQTRSIVVKVPHILGVNRQTAVNIFDHLHNNGLVPHELIAATPEVLCADEKTVVYRLQYLKLLKRAQFDPEQPLYIPLSVLSSEIDDKLFVEKYAHTSVEDYNLFLRTR